MLLFKERKKGNMLLHNSYSISYAYIINNMFIDICFDTLITFDIYKTMLTTSPDYKRLSIALHGPIVNTSINAN